MTCEGVVYEIIDDKTYVYIPRTSSCGGNCASCSACTDLKNKIEVLNNIGAKKGDRVTISMPTHKVMGYAFCVYLLPVLLTIFLVTLSDAYFKSAILDVLVALFCIALWFVAVRVLNKKAKFKNEITSIIDM